MSLCEASGILVNPHTFSAYCTGVRQFSGYVESNALNLLRLSQDEAQAYALALPSQGRKIATVRGKVAAASALCKALRITGAEGPRAFPDQEPPTRRRCCVEGEQQCEESHPLSLCA